MDYELKAETKINVYRKIYNEAKNNPDVLDVGYPKEKEDLDFYGKIGDFLFDFSIKTKVDMLKVKASGDFNLSEDQLLDYGNSIAENETGIMFTTYDQKVMPSQFDAYTGKSPHYYPNGEWCWWPEKMTLESYKALTDVNKATEIFERVFERGSITRMSERYESANLYYDMYKNMTPGTDVQQKIVNAAYSQLGVNYVWGGTTPNVGLDCSGLTQYCYSQAGISIPRTSQEQSAKGKVVTNPEPGDICVSNNEGHVSVYIGDGKVIEAPDVNLKVRISELSKIGAQKFVRFW